uniref:Protein WUSCHEL n=1 Tax=Petunia hybrida TaxID=4102 RepID=A9XDF8_PETHY|nr:SISTER OF EVERGREEN [Petunia x hybrida]
MASSNRHWPSMFKSKPCDSHHHHHQWQHDINSSLIQKAPCNPAEGCEERSPEPKPRWNPRPEQIRILEAIFNSGMVNPPRDEIRKIRAKLQEYGQVGDANVFYWFQNRKSRSKHKQRQSTKVNQQTPHNNITITAPSNSSSSSSDKSSQNSTGHHHKSSSSLTFSIGSTNVMDLLNSPTASVNQQQQTYNFQNEFFLNEPFFFAIEPAPSPTAQSASVTQGLCFPDDSTSFSSSHHVTNPSAAGLFMSELMGISQTPSKKTEMNLQSQLMSYTSTVTSAPSTTTHSVLPLTTTTTTTTIPASSHIQGAVEPTGAAPTRSTVFINDVAFEVGVGPFNVKEVFGEDAVLIHSSGEPLVTNEWGLTIQPLQHGAFYYLLRTSTATHDHNTIDLI